MKNGPCSSPDLPNHPRVNDRRDGVRKLNIGNSNLGDHLQGGGRKTPVYYIEGEHDERTVVETWVDNNQKVVEEVSAKALNWRCPKEFRPALKDVLDIEFSKPEGHGEWERGGTCPMCGEDYSRQLPDHLPDCGGSEDDA
jgi:hypothetical protein